MKVRIQHGDIHLTDLRTRMPFKYGIATLTRTPHAFVRLEVEVDGKAAAGIAADSLPPKWFTKDPARPLNLEVDEMLRVIEHALHLAISSQDESPFALWRQLYDSQESWGRSENRPLLLSNFGTSLVERAMIEAVCRAAGEPWVRMLSTNQLGIRLGDVHKPLTGLAPADLLPELPLRQIIVRQTVGLADPVVDEDIAPAERIMDGLPQSLAASIQAYGLRHFKIKVSGAIEQDKVRLARIVQVIEKSAPADFAFSLDANEQFHSLAEFQTYWADLLDSQSMRRFFAHLLFVEQPFHRDVALAPAVVGNIEAWVQGPPMIIDESDGDLDSLPRALELGYAGASYKNCKGVFKGIANYCLLAQRRRQQPSQPAIMSGEDLVNIGPVALLQDLAACASLGIASVERNGHHYFAGLSMFPARVQKQILEAHGDLYHPSQKGWPALTIKQGMIQLDSVLAAPFGVGLELHVEQFTPAATWRQS